jgi:hypothetical protein
MDHGWDERLTPWLLSFYRLGMRTVHSLRE